MTTRTRPRPIETYIERAKAKLLRKYPDLRFEVRKRSDDEAFLYYYGPYDIDKNGWEMTGVASGVVSDAVVDEGYLLYVLPRD